MARKERKGGPGVIEIGAQPDLPAGRSFVCLHCGTRLKEGQPHTALGPYPHQSLTTLVVNSETLGPRRPARHIDTYRERTINNPGRTIRGTVEAVDARAEFHEEAAFLDGYVYGSHAGITGYRPSLIGYTYNPGPGAGRIVKPLVQGEDGLWREDVPTRAGA